MSLRENAGHVEHESEGMTALARQRTGLNLNLGGYNDCSGGEAVDWAGTHSGKTNKR